MPNPPKKVPAGTRIPGQPNYRMTKSVYKDPASYMDKHEFDAETERLYQAQMAKLKRTTPPSSTRSAPKSNPYASAGIKKPSPKKPMAMDKNLGMGSKIKRAMSPDKLKALVALLIKAGGAPRGQSPMPYTRLGSGMDMD